MPADSNIDKANELASSDPDLPDTLYHYTDLNGLAGIWEKGRMWATNSLYLNDTSELSLGLNVVKSRLAKREIEFLQSITNIWERQNAQMREAGGAIDDEPFNKERAALAPGHSEVKEIREALQTVEDDDSDTYIACLSEHGDQLSQWRGYAREGYCIGIDTKALLGSLPEGRVMKRVQYYDEATADSFAERIISLAKGYRHIVREMDEGDVDVNFQSFVIARFSVIEAAFMKDSSFREEGEVRIVETSMEPDLFTPHRYGMVPRRYIAIPAGAIRSVTVGPSAHEQLKQQSLIRYFLRTGFAGSELPPIGERVRPLVTRSRIPFRDW